MEKLLVEKPDQTRDNMVKQWAADVAKEYSQSYDKFLKSIQNPALDDEVDEYLSNLSKDQRHE